jgi:hypothetical protein
VNADHPETGGAPSPTPLTGVRLVAIGDDDAGACVDGVCLLPGQGRAPQP